MSSQGQEEQLITNWLLAGKFRELQRLTVQYARILDLTRDEETVDGQDKQHDASMDVSED